MRSIIWLLGIWAVLGLVQAKPLTLAETENDATSSSSSSSSSSEEQEEQKAGSLIVSSEGSSSEEDRPKRSIPDPDQYDTPVTAYGEGLHHPDQLAHEHHRGKRSPKADSSSSSSEEDPAKENTKKKVDTSAEDSSSSEEHKKLKIAEQRTETNAVRRKRQLVVSKEDDKPSVEIESTEFGTDDAEPERGNFEVDEVLDLAAKTSSDKDKASIEDYAQGCEVMEVSSKEANETTYVE
ncbi:uncharacterized protein Dwil_GK17979, isoform B [Drosophila willistoni]|uniref:Uncharacterized protein, isoform B n=1 Tax=Drosophila willistoni TaxID=7260 RepID=A0A0Q9WUD4_DROWI|nr:nucleolin 1 isoform X2 [Drosophila willistoni]KRF99160.1 uncharacterized protein Dwil_GK17979, isoform B [Drosophila willistoni]